MASPTLAEACADFVTTRELAALLRKTPRTIETWRRKGYLPYIQVGRSVLFSRREVEAHLMHRFHHDDGQAEGQTDTPPGKTNPRPG